MTKFYHLTILLILLILSACSSTQTDAANLLDISIQVDGQVIETTAEKGKTIDSIISAAGIAVSNLDIIEPAGYVVLTEPASINITRVREELLVEENTIPFVNQTVKNETLPEGQTLLIQPGKNGIQQVTTRVVYQDGIENSRNVIKIETIQAAEPEIIMVGVQTPFATLPIEGKIAYLTTGNAWIMEGDTANRRPVVTTGDLDGRVFSLSPDGNYLLFTRSEATETTGDINSLWAINVSDPEAEAFSLKAKNIVHFAAWIPGQTNAITYSTVEPREAAPGWQANNDLYRVVFNSAEIITQIDEIIGTNQGGDYGWWGTQYAWSPDGRRLAYARPDSVGLVDLESNTLVPLMALNAYTTHSNWAWVPSLGWSYDHSVLYTVNHEAGSTTGNQNFNLAAILPNESMVIPIIENAGMFCYPAASPNFGNDRYLVAYLQAIFPEKSDTSRYRLLVMDQDGSNRQLLFPEEGSLGIDPQEIQWEPFSPDGAEKRIGAISGGNIFFINIDTGAYQQITGDGAVNLMDWR